GRIGVTIQDVNAQLAESFGLERPHGALVSSVEKDGPAAHAGIAAGDVILGVGGHAIERYGELSGAIAAMRPGSDATLSVWRNGRRVHSVKELQDAAKSAGKSVALLIQREDAQIFVPLRLP